MATIKLTVSSNFGQASSDIKSFGDVTEAQRKKIEKYIAAFKPAQIDNFVSKQSRATAAVKATRGPVAAAKAEHTAYRVQIEKLIKNGLDPQDEALKELRTTYAKLEDQVESNRKEQAKAEAQTKRNETAMKALKVAAVAGGIALVRAFIDFSKESAEAASQAEEIESKYLVVFRDISKEAKLAASTIATEFDLAASTVNNLLGDAGDILTGLGFDQETALELSTTVTTLGIDLASFTNFAGGAEGATSALVKAMLGEAESAKALGIVIRQDTKEYKDLVAGLMESEHVGLTQAKALAAIQIATEQSKNAVGDYARTLDSATNIERTMQEQIKRSKENWGALLNEGLTPVRRAFRDFLKEMNDVEEESKNLNNALSGAIGSDLERAIAGQQEALSKAIADRDKLIELGRSESALASERVASAQENLAILKEQLELQKQGQGYAGILKSLEDEKATAAEKTASALAEQQRWTDMRKEAESSLLIDLQKINDTEALSLKLGKEYNSEQEKAKAVWETINTLRQEGFGVEGAGIQNILDKYGDLFIVYESLGERLTELNNIEAEKQLENIETFQTFLDARMTQEAVSGGQRIAFLRTELSRIKSLETISNKEKVSALKATNILILDEMTKKAIADRERRAEDLANETAMSEARIALREKELGIISGFFGSMSELIASFAGDNREAAIAAKALAHAQAGINSALAFTQVLSDPTLPWWAKGFKAAAVLASGITQQVSIANTAIPSAQTGTGKTGIGVSRSGTSSQADNVPVAMVSEGETLTVGARGESSGSAGTMNLSVIVDDDAIFKVVNIGIESGDIRITSDNIQGGLSA